jgi:hypothetical protein
MANYFQQALAGLNREGNDFTQQDEFAKKQAALQNLVNQAQEETQTATENAGIYSAMGKVLDSMSANKMALGPGFQPVRLGSNANAEGILNAYQGAKAAGAGNKLKSLLENYQLMNQGEGVNQKFAEGRTDANKGIANAYSYMAGVQQRGAGQRNTDALKVLLDSMNPQEQKEYIEQNSGFLSDVPIINKIPSKYTKKATPGDYLKSKLEQYPEIKEVMGGNVPANKSAGETPSETERQSITSQPKLNAEGGYDMIKPNGKPSKTVRPEDLEKALKAGYKLR